MKTENALFFRKKRPVIMGVLNVTPDSFFDGGKFFNNKQVALDHIALMLESGAEIIDIGGESTRPGADPVSIEEELERVIPIIETAKSQYGENILISIDTYKAEVAREAVKRGADIINDVSGLQLDRHMADVISSTSSYIVINHMRGNPKTMQKGEIIYEDVIKGITSFFEDKIHLLEGKGIGKERIILDPGFGFGKTSQQNIEILNRLKEFDQFELPILIGVSRKSTLGKILQESLNTREIPAVTDRLEASLAANAIAVLNGASIIRTHDVIETKKFFSVFNYIRNGKNI